MDERNLKRLEFDRVKEKLAEFAVSTPGRELIGDLVPFSNRDEIVNALEEVTEGRELLRLDPTARLGGWNDVRQQARRCERGALLDPQELWHVLQTLTACRQIKNFFSERQDSYTRLNEIAMGLGSFKDLEKMIASAIAPGGEVLDRASERLFNIRRRLASAQQRIKDRLNEIIRSTSYQKYLQDPIVTMREGRYVVPVKQEYRSQLPGIVHDQSASGATLFIEPMPVVEANNEVRGLMAEEKQEVTRILTELSAAVGRQAEELLYALENLARLDFIMAKARYSESLDAWAPCIATEAKLDIRQGRHPLLPVKAVPISIQLGEAFDMLVITGPNTGGKTVSLKTVGLLVLMAHSGLHVPAEDGTLIGMFDQVFADIGDEQSIEQSLSTFSSHTINIVNILKKAGNKSLVLLDELGAGTDPTEGSALARAILDQLRQQGAKVVATTHYGELKSYAFANERVENASVEFNSQTLRPTYRLLIGRPGRSNAFEIALRLGLNESVIQRARGFLTEEQVQVADLMRELENARVQAEQEQAEAEKIRREAEQYREQYMELAEKIRQRKDEIITRAVADSREMVKKARLEAEQLVEELRAALKEQTTHNREQSISNARQCLKQLQLKIDAKAPQNAYEHPTEAVTNVKPGDEVFIPKYGQRGVVLEAPGQDDQVQVQVGMIRMTIARQELRRAATKETARPRRTGVGQLVQQKARDISPRLDMRGMRVDEGLAEVEKYLDDACVAGLPLVQLVHGKGTGALRSAVQKLLKEHHRVKTFRLGEQGEGGSGVTVVELK
ncbi:endonuclease MutS2 [Desulfoscipio gibsoniae]|uniref:Endonuclease MutS2 n=1 Tax=Desulfoscipio gibsoniae DSM 7213 TaxID=767817 RepID=R4KDA8_9FIRM|nr:endonuclease MutS2 [Desulfoscipio gibsoniae]AGL01173.1 MutS2 family protein [Desulfoscipio gibsoniae DSM 7213]